MVVTLPTSDRLQSLRIRLRLPKCSKAMAFSSFVRSLLRDILKHSQPELTSEAQGCSKSRF